MSYQPVRSRPGTDFLDFLKKRGGDFGRPQDGTEQRELFGQEFLDDFLSGKLALQVQSSMITYAKYSLEKEAMEFGYKGGATAVFTSFELALAKDFAAAPSKGKWYHARMKAGVNPDGTWIHTRPYHEGKTLKDFLDPVMGRPAD